MHNGQIVENHLLDNFKAHMIEGVSCSKMGDVTIYVWKSAAIADVYQVARQVLHNDFKIEVKCLHVGQ